MSYTPTLQPTTTTIDLTGLSGTITTLTVAQVSNKVIRFTGTPAGAVTVPFPSVPGYDWIVDNATTSGTVTIGLKGATATTFDISALGTRAVYYDAGTDNIEPVTTVGGSGGHTIQEEGVSLPARGNLNFVGANITTTDDVANATTKVEAVIVPTRQTVLYAPVDTAGLPTFLPASSVSLVLTTQNITANNYIEATASQRSVDVIGRSTTNLTWPACTANATNYLPVLASGGTLTPQAPVTLAPIYQWGGTPAVTAGQYTFNIQEMTMYLGNGTVANPVNHVIVGEVVAGATTIISTVAYALQGRYHGVQSVVATNTVYFLAHNIGVPTSFLKRRRTLYCKVADASYLVGDRTEDFMDGNAGTGGSWYGCNLILRGSSVIASMGPNGIGAVPAINGLVAFTPTSWGLEVDVWRGF